MDKFRLSIITVSAVLVITPLAFADAFLSPDGTGTYVGGLPKLAPHGTYVGGTPTITPYGFYVDGIPKKKNALKKWQQKRKIDG